MGPNPSSSFPPGPPPAAPTAPASSPASWTTTGAPADVAQLGPTLAGKDLETWTPATEGEARNAIGDVADFCRRYCPVRLACVEDNCRLFRLEGRSLEALGMARNPATEAVGVVGSSVVGLG